MPKQTAPKGGKHKGSGLAKAIATQRHKQEAPVTAAASCLSVKTAAAVAEFSINDPVYSSSAKRAPTNAGMQTVLGPESSINVERRIRNAAIPITCEVHDDAEVVQTELSTSTFETSKDVRRLMPRRPAWSYELSSGHLHHRELQAFKRWILDVRSLMEERGGYPPAFEQNIQVWRQLWRVLERSDVAVIVLDARCPLLHLPPALVFHVRRTLRKPIVLVLNKLDTVSPAHAVMWARRLKADIAGVSHVVGFSKEFAQTKEVVMVDDGPSQPAEGDSQATTSLPVGKGALLEACHLALSEHRQASEENQDDATVAPAPQTEETQEQGGSAERILIGLVGHPNVGKSSLVNNLMGEKVVSVKATPGHTKTLQSLVLDEKTSLCDSPGVVFPRLEVAREAQIVGMLIPLAQVREPFSAIRWVMQRVAPKPLPELLNLKPATVKNVVDLQDAGVEALRLDMLDVKMEGSSAQSEIVPWSPMLLCARYALQRGLTTSGRPDCMKAGMEILERVLEGRVPYAVAPPDAPAAQSTANGENSGDSSGSDSDWDINDDDDYESEEEAGADSNQGLLDMFGVDPKGPGVATRQSRKRTKRKEQLAAKTGEPTPEEARRLRHLDDDVE